MNNYNNDRIWSDELLPNAMQILCEHFTASRKEDVEHNTDVFMVDVGPRRVSCRFRRHKYLKQYGNEATFRVSRPSGATTEIQKMMAGWGRFSFCGFANRKGTGFERWFILDLNVLREHIKGLKKPPKLYRNPDGTTFWAFNVWDIPGFVIASSMDPENQPRQPK